MRNIVRAALVALVATATPLLAQAQAPAVPKLAYINSQLILQQAPGRAEAEAQFERESAAYRQQVQRMGDSLNTLIAAYDKEQTTLSPTARDTRQKAIQTREAEYQRRAQEMEQKMNARQQELVQPIMDKVQQAINDVRNEEGYTMIFDAAAASPVLVSADKNLDITDKIVARLRATATTATTPPTPKPAGVQQQPAGVTRPPKP